MEQKIRRGKRPRAGRVAGHRPDVQRVDVCVDPHTRPHEIDDNQPDDQSEGRNQLEIDNGLKTKSTNFSQVSDLGDPHDDGRKDDGRDHHLDKLDEGIAERLHLRSRTGKEKAQSDTDSNSHQHLKIQVRVDWFSF